MSTKVAVIEVVVVLVVDIESRHALHTTIVIDHISAIIMGKERALMARIPWIICLVVLLFKLSR